MCRRHSPMTRMDTDCWAPVGTRERQRTPGEAALPLRWGAPGSLQASHHALLTRPSPVAPKRVRR